LLGNIPLVHFSFKALILRALCARKMSILSPLLYPSVTTQAHSKLPFQPVRSSG
jgi:hypothetical protein